MSLRSTIDVITAAKLLASSDVAVRALLLNKFDVALISACLTGAERP